MKEVLDYLFGRLKAERPVTIKVGEQDYAVKADGTLGEPIRELAPQWTPKTFEVSSLAALAALIRGNVDEIQSGSVGLHVVDPFIVELVSIKSDKFGRRHVYARAKHAKETPFVFDVYHVPEKFRIDFIASFFFNEDATKVLQLISSLGSGDAVAVRDDGLSQEVEVKSGTVTRAAVSLPQDGIPLTPWRTFRDVAPVTSKFLLRLKGVKDQLPQVALFEIDAKWRIDTITSIQHWLERNVEGVPVIA
jgi:hypothetical protein